MLHYATAIAAKLDENEMDPDEIKEELHEVVKVQEMFLFNSFGSR